MRKKKPQYEENPKRHNSGLTENFNKSNSNQRVCA